MATKEKINVTAKELFLQQLSEAHEGHTLRNGL